VTAGYFVRKKNVKKAEAPPVHFTRFVSIDFETADHGRDSACAIGLVVVENRKIVRQITELIRPPRRYFQFTWLHGIGWEDVADKPTFAELWPTIAPCFEGADFIAAHNASFDRGVLDECCGQSGGKAPDIRYLCTMRLARALWDIRPTKLSDVCGQFGISLQHHDAGSDALACARIVMRADGSGVPESAFLKPAVKRIAPETGV
jgi:DNA polymerase-3 subunit epsilon